MKRTLYDKLNKWKASQGRQPLILRGARQVGKTHLLMQFGRKEFNKCHHFDFEKSGATLKPLFEKELSPKQIIANLSLFVNQQIEGQNSLIIFDEIQNCPRALTCLKYFSEEMPEQAICAAGSLLGVMLTNESFPVGKVIFLDLYPMNFEEFIYNSDNSLLYKAYSDLLSDDNPSPLVHEKLWELLRQYYVVGGMPQAVKKFLELRENQVQGFSEAREVQRGLLDTYLRDFNKHAGGVNAIHISSVFENIPQQLSSHIDESVQRYRFRGVIPGKNRFAALQSPIEWLIKSGLVYKTHICAKVESPLKAFTKQNIFKLYLFDVGLLGCMLEISPKALMLQDFGQTKGFFAENYVACELIAAGEKNLYSWSGNQSEIEFIKDWEGEIIPIEVKSGVRTKARSLMIYMKKYNPRMALKITANPLRFLEGPVINAPLYCSGKTQDLLRLLSD